MSPIKDNNASAILRIVTKNSKEEPHKGIEERLMTMEGVSNVRINYVTETVAVEYDSRKVTLAEIRKKLRNH